MRLYPIALLACLMMHSLIASADVLPPEAANAMARLQKNPHVYDRIDQFCQNKKIYDKCIIPGTPFSGGGQGSCKNSINQETSSIDLICVRTGEVTFDRKLPEGGFVYDDFLCKDRIRQANEPVWNCTPITPMPVDQFCKNKKIGDACTVDLIYQGKHELNTGLCKEVTEESGREYYRGYHTAKRNVIRCEAPPEATREYSPVKWWQKLLM